MFRLAVSAALVIGGLMDEKATGAGCPCGPPGNLPCQWHYAMDIIVLPLEVHVKKVFPGEVGFAELVLWCQWQYNFRMAKDAPKRRHDKPMQIRMNEELFDLIHLASEKSGLTASGWVRDRLARLARRELRGTGDEAPRKKPRAGEDAPGE